MHHISVSTKTLLVAVLAAVAGGAMGQTVDQASAPASPHVRSMAATCAACHGTDGHAVDGESMVALAGYPRAALVAQMRAFRDGGRPATVMHQIARGYTDAQVDALAAYFAAQPVETR